MNGHDHHRERRRAFRFGLPGIVCVVLIGAVAQPVVASTIGGWDTVRGGPYSFSAGANTAALRTLLGNLFPGVSITGTTTLTPAYLSTLDAVVVACGFSDASPITPLSPAEQTALMNFVLGGGRALILGDRTGYSPLVNPTLIDLFGLHIDGNLFGHLPATVAAPASHPITAGPFGSVSTLQTINPGWFDQLGPARTLATLDTNGKPLLAAIAGGALGPGSGKVILSADSDIYVVNLTLIENTFAYLVPEPSGLALVSAGSFLVGVLALRRTKYRTDRRQGW